MSGSLMRWSTSVLASALLLFAPKEVDACKQMDLRKIANTNGEITDYQTNSDELEVWFNIGKVVRYTWESKMNGYTQYFMDPGVISLPCYGTEVFWMLVKEKDTLQSDLH